MKIRMLLSAALAAVALLLTACEAPATTVPVSPVDTASGVTGPPADMTGINRMHGLLRATDSSIQFGTQADPDTVTLGPTDGGVPTYPPYEGKNSLNIKMPKMTPVLAPLDVRFVGFKNRSATYRQRPGMRVSPFDDLELCFESVSDDWPGLVLCVYHLYTTPLLQAHLDNEACGIQEEWDGSGARKGRIYYLDNSTEGSENDPESCEPLLGSVIERGGVIGYSGQVGTNPHSGFRFKVRSEDQNPLTTAGDPYLHWVQPSVFFYWQCFEQDAIFQPGVLAYPFDCESLQSSIPDREHGRGFKPSLEERYEVSVEEAVVYGTGGTLDGGQIELLLDLTIPDTGIDGPRPLYVHIHGGGFTGGSRFPQWDVAKHGWVAASIDYRLVGDEPLPGPRFQGFRDAVDETETLYPQWLALVAAVEDTLVALDYLLGRADELDIDRDRIVLQGFSAGAFTALNVAYCTDEFGIDRPTIAAVIDFSGALTTVCEGAVIDPGEAAAFVVHGTEDTGTTSFTRALRIVDEATAAGITYEFHPLEGVGHLWEPTKEITADGRTINEAMYEFLDRVLYSK